MNVKELVDAVAEKTGNTKADVRAILDATGEVVTAELYLGGEATLPGLGKLKTKQTTERTGRNPKTGEELRIPSRKAVKFTAATALKDALN